MANVLVLFAHPAQQQSRINRALADVARQTEGITFVDLYAKYPRFKIDIDAEQDQLLAHDVLVLQFPVYWYSTPSILKEWQDLVLEFGWAYGPGGDKLTGKRMMPVVTLGGAQEAYGEGGRNQFELRTLLSPLEATANLCGMTFLPPLALFSAHQARDDGRQTGHADDYRRLLTALREDRFDAQDAPLTDPATLPQLQGA